jgi:type I restriction enzyme S subunit
MVSEVGTEVEGAIPYTGLIRLTPRKPITKDYIRLIVESSVFLTQIDLLKAGATIQHFGPSHLGQMKIPLPPLEEQVVISTYIAAAASTYDTLTVEAELAINLLKERRAALISAAVTGKIDVRDLVPVVQQAA